MESLFSCLTWNVENFGTNSRDSDGKLKPAFKNKVSDITQTIKNYDPDVFAIFEVRSTDVFYEFMNHFEGYTFQITEGPQTQETLVGVKGKFNSFITQKLEFKTGNSVLRPGVLLTLIINGIHYTLLFVHFKSMNDPSGWGLRDQMFDKMRSLKKAINTMAGSPDNANFIVAGDFNTMGMNYTYGDHDVSPEQEITRMKKLVHGSSYRMRLPAKSHSYTYYNGGEPGLTGNLDHVVASDHLVFRDFEGSEVKVCGLTDFPYRSAEQKNWTKRYSDHGFLYFEILDQNF
ncbi:MAG: endonuclease/exonuclease/phosphatase family protein [Bacteroidales bacterium]|nr:endonuclease/exonuclease/phosphatase family protein [Bacteroidales bacterium]